MTEHAPRPRGESLPVGHEPDQVNVRSVVIMGLILGAVIVGALAILVPLYSRLKPRPADAGPATWQRDERRPIDFDQPAQLRALRKWEDKELHAYGWRDEEKTTARVPIERAMQILVENGDPFAKEAGEQELEPAQQPPPEPEQPGQDQDRADPENSPDE